MGEKKLIENVEQDLFKTCHLNYEDRTRLAGNENGIEQSIAKARKWFLSRNFKITIQKTEILVTNRYTKTDLSLRKSIEYQN